MSGLLSRKYFFTIQRSNLRHLNTSLPQLKRYKYALNKSRQLPGGGRSQNNQRRRGGAFFEGTQLTFFELGNNKPTQLDHSPKQLAYSDIVKSAVESLLASGELPEELTLCPFEFVKVEVAPSLCSAVVVWRFLEGVPHHYTKEEVEHLLVKHSTQIRCLLPAHSTVTQTPVVSFAFDKFTEQQKTLEELFESIAT